MLQAGKVQVETHAQSMSFARRARLFDGAECHPCHSRPSTGSNAQVAVSVKLLQCVLVMHSLAASLARYLVDPASSHMLVSKIKPCMSKYKP